MSQKKNDPVDALAKLMTPAQDREHLRLWIKRYCKLDFPHQTVSRFSDCNPFEFIWMVYRAIMDGKPLAVLGLAGRDGFKTLALSVIDLLAFLHDGRDTIHISMTSAQGQRARTYLEKYLNGEPLISRAIAKQNNKEVRLQIDDQLVGMEVLPATPKAVQGGHCSLLTFDEVSSSMEPKNVQAYRDSHGILGSSRKGKPAVIVKITSRQQRASLAEQEIANASQTGLKIMRWTTLDATEKCPDARSGTVPTPLWANPLDGTKYTEEEFKSQVPAEKQANYQLTADTFDKCRKCRIAAFCLGDLKKQTSTSPLLRTIDDVINKISLAGSWDWATAQIMSLKPASSGNVYFEFDRKIHVPGWDVMWLALTGHPSAIPVTRDLFVAELKRRGANFYAGIDWGWSSPSVCVILAVDRRETCYLIDTMSRTYTNDPEFIELVRQTVHKKYDIQMYCPDLANGSGNDLIKQAGLPTTDEIDKRINMGVNLVKGLLRVPGTNQQTRIYFAPDLGSGIENIPGILEEMELYHKEEDATGRILDDADPEDEFNHALDALRYMVYWLFGRNRMKMGTDYVKPPETFQTASNIPDLEKIARDHGIPYVDNRDVPVTQEEDAKPGGAIFSWT